MPKISIVLPIYNSEKYLHRALNSCLNQSLKDIEIICVDDCGSDKSIEIIKEFMLEDSRLKLVKNEKNEGIYRSKRHGALASSGEFLMFLDPDDELLLDACEILYETIAAKNVDFVHFNGVIFDEGKQEKIASYLDESKVFSGLEFREFFIKNKAKWVLWLKIYESQMYKNALASIDSVDSKIRTNITEDVLVFYHILSTAKSVFMLNKCFYNYYLQSTSVTKDLSKSGFLKSVDDYQNVINLIEKSAKKNEFDKEFTQNYLKRIKVDKYSFMINFYKKQGYFKNFFNIFGYKILRRIK